MSGFPFFIAKRYLISKKSSNVIHWISWISVAGVSIGTMAMLIVLAVFSGLNQLVEDLFSGFNAELEITVAEGKFFLPDQGLIQILDEQEGIANYVKILEDNALVKYNDAEVICNIKAVDTNYTVINPIEAHISDGKFVLKKGMEYFAVPGHGVAMNLEMGLNFIDPLILYYPKKNINTINPESSIQRKLIYPSGFFEIQNNIDFSYILVDLDFGRELFDEPEQVSSIEILTDKKLSVYAIKSELQSKLGSGFIVKDRLEQESTIFKTMQSEKFISFLILAFIILIASFNIIGSLTMLIIDKKKDVATLRELGAEWKDIRKIFLLEGWMISILGAFIGIAVGLLVCLLQDTVGIIPLQGDGNFIIDYYPVKVEIVDLLKVGGIVLFIGFLAAWYPVKILINRLIQQSDSIYSAS